MLEQINHHWETGLLEYPFGRGVNFQIDITGILSMEELLDRVKRREISLFRGLSIAEYKANGAMVVQKEILLQDPDGYLLRFSETVAPE